jgi:hypothetical protein
MRLNKQFASAAGSAPGCDALPPGRRPQRELAAGTEGALHRTGRRKSTQTGRAQGPTQAIWRQEAGKQARRAPGGGAGQAGARGGLLSKLS